MKMWFKQLFKKKDQLPDYRPVDLLTTEEICNEIINRMRISGRAIVVSYVDENGNECVGFAGHINDCMGLSCIAKERVFYEAIRRGNA